MDNNVGFFVFVVESPSDVDFYHGRSEGYLLAQAAGLDEVPCVVRTAINKAAFIAALRLGITEAMATYPDRLPILHISAHGATSGIQLSSGDVVPHSPSERILDSEAALVYLPQADRAVVDIPDAAPGRIITLV